MRIGIVLGSNRLAVSASLLVMFALSAGCNAIVNFDDFQFHPDEAGDSGSPDGGPKPDSGPDDKDAGPDDKDSGMNMSCESQTETCDNGSDDDCDQLSDCEDPDCKSNAVCCVRNQSAETTCSGGVDNDCDGKVDCKDSDCSASVICCPSVGLEADPGACDDSTDNDCDGLTDCEDSGCTMQLSCCVRSADENTAGACADSADNDCDGLKDCLDPDCVAVCCTKSPSGATSEASCTDNVDNDCDGKVDCQDGDCDTNSACAGCIQTATTETSCIDNLDNDCDKDRDCRDTECVGTLACCVSSGSENSSSACIDRSDNDCDGLIDCSDPDCSGQRDCCRASPEGNLTPGTCNDLIDNDCDGMTDLSDNGCCSASGAENSMAACSDSVDNDCDGLLNCTDPDCAGIGTCCVSTGVGTQTIIGGCNACVPDGMTDAAAPNDGKDNECDGLRDIPVLNSAFPTQGLPSSADEVRLKFAPEIVATARLYCWTHRPNNTTPSWVLCPMSGTDVKPFTADASTKPENNGLWVTDVRWEFDTGEKSQVFSFKHYVHNTLHGVGHCAQPHSDMQWFSKAAPRLSSPDAGVFKPGVDTFLASPFIRVQYKIPSSAWKDWKLDGSDQKIDMPSLRRRFTLSGDGKFLLITRNYTSTRSGSCNAGWIKVHNSRRMASYHNNFVDYSCRAIVLNRAGAGVCLNDGGATGPVIPVYSESNEVFANTLGWSKANKFMWRILVERKTDGPVNFTKKCVAQPCTNGGIFLPDRGAFPPSP